MKSIKLFSEDRSGLIADITEILAEHSINIEDIEGKVIDGQAIIDLIVEKPSEAITYLREKGFKALSNDLLTIRLLDEPGASARITRELGNARISIKGISTLYRKDGYCYVALSTDNDDVARKLLHEVVI